MSHRCVQIAFTSINECIKSYNLLGFDGDLWKLIS